MFRRLFGGEERTEQEIQQAEKQTEQSLQKTRQGFFGRISALFQTEDPITDELWDELEELLIQADVGVETSLAVVEQGAREGSAARASQSQRGARAAQKGTDQDA
ncbi:MAG: hypothetical protein KatS3mg057_0694 [Herpetosiphonaceae bacterium]|nr:MAG: hypothetical protein KatS3mg057_0694 [Herpetosiphonaceae bacterium]